MPSLESSRVAALILAVGLIVFPACAPSEGPEPTESTSESVATDSVPPSPSPAGGETGSDGGGDPTGDGEGGERGSPALVTRVVDGDTIEVDFRGEMLDIRLIGVDTPETVHPSEPVQCYGPQASQFTTSELEGEDVRLEFDIERLDRYGRTLAYVWRNEELFNELLVAKGYGVVSTYPPNVKYVDEFVAAQRAARNGDLGLWKACADESGEGSGNGGGSGGGSGTCDPSYPDDCIPPYPPDLDCGDIPYSSFAVVGSDPHGFDGDDDGVGCES